MRLVFFGSPETALPSLEALCGADLEPLLVVTQPDRGRRRDMRGFATPVKSAALARGIEVESPKRVADIAGILRWLEPDIAAVVAFGQLLPAEVREVFRLGMVNLHFSLLPRWRGAAPVQRAILAGDAVTGVTTMLIDEGLDTGACLAKREVSIRQSERAGELSERLAHVGAELLVETIRSLEAGEGRPEPQPAEGATYASKLTAEECEIDWRRPAREVVALVRAAHPRPGAHSWFRGRRLRVLNARTWAEPDAGESGRGGVDGSGETAPEDWRGEPGRLEVAGGQLLVSAGDGAVELLEVQLEGKPVRDGAAFVRGARIEPGERLGI